MRTRPMAVAFQSKSNDLAHLDPAPDTQSDTGTRLNNMLSAAVLCVLATAGGPALAQAKASDAAARPAAVPEQASDTKAFNIDAPKLSRALIQLTEQAGLQLIYPANDKAESLPARPVVGQFTTEAALERLLQGSGLRYEFLDSRTIAIVSTHAKTTQTVRRLNGGKIRLAHADDTTSQVASSQSRPEDSGNDSGQIEQGQLEEIVVTAQKREERLQDVPISISVLGGRELDSSTAQGVMAALTTVPGVGMFQGFQTGGPLISVRGVTALNNFGGGANPIAYYLDTVPFSFVKSAITPDASGYDLERVEVLRGPQSTLYGASAQNGVVRVLTKDADLDSLELKVRTSGSYTEDGGENYRGDAAVNIPIIEGKLAARAVGGYQSLSGWIDRPNVEDANDAEIRNFRLKVNAAPTEQLSIGLSGWLSRADYGAPPASTDQRTHRSLVSEAINDDFDVYALKVGYQFENFTLSSNSSYIDYTLDSELDVNLAASGTLLLTTNLANRLFAQEVYLNSTHGGAWRWSVGAMYRDAEDKSYQLRHNAAGVPVGGYVQPARVSQLSESRAVFGELTRLFADGKLELTGGLRYFEDDVGLREHARFTSTTATLVNTDNKFDATSPRAVLTWHITDQMTSYASYAEGFRSGADQGPTIVELAPYIPATKPANLTNYEIGLKGKILDGRLAYDTSVYYMDWQDVQQVISVAYQTASLSALINGVSASGLGFDMSVTAEPTDAFNVGVSLSVNDLSQDADVITQVSPTQSYVLNKEGQRLPLSPRYTASGRAGYEFSFGNSGYRGEFTTSANYVSKRSIFYLLGSQQVELSGDSLTVIDAQFVFASPHGWTLTLFGDNLADEDGTASRHPSWPEWTSRPRPRTIGLQLDYKL